MKDEGKEEMGGDAYGGTNCTLFIDYSISCDNRD